jgi:hypothetical protein
MTESMNQIQVDSEVAEEMFELAVDRQVGRFQKAADVEIATGRWDRHMWLVFFDREDGSFWAIEYSLGLTENQEHVFPWKPDYWERPATVEAFRVVPRSRTVVSYDRVK